MLEVTITGFEGAENHIQDVGDTDSRRVVESVWDQGEVAYKWQEAGEGDMFR